jgi:hypothetical protein
MRKFLTTALGAAVLTGTAAVATPSAQASVIRPHHIQASRSCSVLIDRQGHTLQTECATGDRAPALKPTTTAAQSSTLLMTWWQDAGWHGDYTYIYGNSGDCDSAGYSVTPNEHWENNLSSITGHGHCNTVALWDASFTFFTRRNLPTTFGATIWNDFVGRVHVYRH